MILAGGAWLLRSDAVPGASGETGSQVLRSQRVNVLRELPHDTSCFTQGLLWLHGQLFESCGQTGVSTLRRVDPATGDVEQQVSIAAQYWAEGLARVDDRLIMLTYRAQRALVFGIERFDDVTTFRYRGEGWGLCHDGRRLVMSNGSDRLTFRDPASFEETGGIRRHAPR